MYSAKIPGGVEMINTVAIAAYCQHAPQCKRTFPSRVLNTIYNTTEMLLAVKISKFLFIIQL